MDGQKNEFLDVMWMFARGDMLPVEFEKFIYARPDLEAEMPSDLYLTVLSFDYKTAELAQVQNLRKNIAEWLKNRFPLPCACYVWSNQKTFILSADDEPFGDCLSVTYFDNHYTRLKKRTPWQEVVKCQVCGTGWLVGIDTVEDDILLRRLSETQLTGILSHDKWPNYFDGNPNLWPQGE